MLKHTEPLDTLDLNVEHPDTLEQLPKLPDDVVIPDDVSQLLPEGRERRRMRWGWWAALLALVAGGSVYLMLRPADDSPADVETPAVDVPAYDLKQQAIDEQTAWIERLPDVKEYYVNLYEHRLEFSAPAAAVPVYDLKQQAIDEQTAWIERLPDVKEYYVNLYEHRLDNQAG